MTDRVPESMRDLQQIADSHEVGLAVSLALLNAHKLSSVPDREAITALESRVKNDAKSAGEMSLYNAGLYLWQAGRSDKARDLTDKLLKLNRSSVRGLALRGWIDLTSGRDAYSKKADRFFNEAIKAAASGGSQQGIEIDAMFGKARFLMSEGQQQGSAALDILNTISGTYQNFSPALIEKAKGHLALSDWDAMIDTVQRCLDFDRQCIDSHRLHVMHQLCRVGNYVEAARRLGDLIAALDSSEPSNHVLYFECSLAVTRVSGRHHLVLQQTRTLLERALALSPNSPDYIVELGYHYVLSGDPKQAMKTYRQAMVLDETSVKALTGVIWCQLLEDQLDEAAQQLEFLNEIQSSIGVSAEVGYLSALLASKRQTGVGSVVQQLSGAVSSHHAALEGELMSFGYLERLNPDLMLQIAHLYLDYGPTEAPRSGETVSPVMQKCMDLLEPLARQAPGLLEGVYMLAKSKYLSGAIDAAKSRVQYCLTQDNTYADAHILMARINLSQGNGSAAKQCLEVGLSYNFEVRESPIFHLIQAQIEQADGKLEDAIRTLAKAMKLPGIRRAAMAGTTKRNKRPATLSERVSIYLELAQAFWKSDMIHEATKVMSDAMIEFEGSSEETRVHIANANIAVQRGDIESALSALTAISPQQSYFIEAKEMMAKIYLHHRKDKALYAACYRELVEQNPSGHTCLLLGDAYMSIQEPEKAIEVYDSALKKNPRDAVLANKIGLALIKTHDFSKAINYYEAAVKSGSQPQLRVHLAELYLKLRQYDKAERVLNAALDHAPSDEIEVLQEDVRYFMLLSRMHHEANRPAMAILVLVKAKEAQTTVLRRTTVESPETLKQQKVLAAEICINMAQHYQSQKETAKAVAHYTEALSHDESNEKAMLALARLYIGTGDLDGAQHQLVTLLKDQPDNNAATIMMADLMFQKKENDSAAFHFQQLLERDPDHYEALAKLIDLFRRAGKLGSVPQFIDSAEKSSPRPDTEPGLKYCRGLYHRLCGEADQAVKCFNFARKDTEWGTRALYHMVETTLNPDDETLGGEIFEAGKSKDPEALAAALQTAEKLLAELAARGEGDSTKFKVMANYVRMGSKSRADIDKALNGFKEVVETDPDSVPGLLGMARAYMMLKAAPKARHQLKRIQKMTYNVEFAEEFEGAWLLLADVFIGSGKHDLAQDPLKKCLANNRSCSKAWEYMGHIFEKDQAYVDASEFYDNAWTYCNGLNASIGYKLAFNYLKARRFVGAIDICLKVLAKDPKFPKIRATVLGPARAALRC